MTAATLLNQTRVESSHLSEVMPLKATSIKTFGFRLSPPTTREEGLRLGFHLSRHFPGVVAVWDTGCFFAIAATAEKMPNAEEWQTALTNIQEDMPEAGDRIWTLREVKQPNITADVLAHLAEQVLRVCRPFSSVLVKPEKSFEVRRRADFSAELIERPSIEQDAEKKGSMTEAALSISVSSKIIFRGTLADFCETHPFRNELETLLVGLKVEDIDSGSTATVVEIVGTLGEMRESLLKKASGSISKQALKESPNDQLVVGVKFGRVSKTIYHYPLAGLRPCVTPQTADTFDVDYGGLLKATKISYLDRQRQLQSFRGQASNTLKLYGLELRKSINGLHDSDLFWTPRIPLEKVRLLFGNGVTSTSQDILSGLKRGGVYHRHKHYCPKDGATQTPIRMTVLNLFRKGTSIESFIGELRQSFRKYQFDSTLLTQDLAPLKTMSTQDAAARAQLDQLIEDSMAIPSDLYLVFLPTVDRTADDSESGSLYHRIYSKLLRRSIASQFIYEDTLQSTPARFLFNQIVPGDLAKLGNLPFVLAAPLSVADRFIGLDVARSAKKKLAGSMNACAGVCLYGKRGEFIRARTEGAAVEGEEIPQRFLEVLLPAAELRGKTVLIYRDGWFRGKEVENLLAWADAIDSKFILVECIKSGVPRLYSLNSTLRQTPEGKTKRFDPKIAAPDRGLALCLTSRSAILVTTQVSEKVGTPRPLRMNIRPEGHQVHIHDVLDATLKLTLMHQGALKQPRLPMVLQGADRLADLRLNGVFISECDRQFWY
ncbi:MAG: Piwi domain-containing protein [Cyanobacteria bacterium J06560_5]